MFWNAKQEKRLRFVEEELCRVNAEVTALLESLSSHGESHVVMYLARDLLEARSGPPKLLALDCVAMPSDAAPTLTEAADTSS